MGMLGAAFLQGAGQGMNTLAAGLMRGVERDEEQTIWEKRAQMLERLRRESAKGMREDEAEFADKRFPTLLSQQTQMISATGKATGEAQTAAEIARANNPELQAAIEAQAKRVQNLELQLKSDAAKDPRTRDLIAQDLKDAQDRMKALMPLEAQRAGMLAGAAANATEAARAKHAPADAFAKLDPTIKLRVQNLAKEADRIDTAITKVQADGMDWNPTENKSQRDLMTRRMVIADKIDSLLGGKQSGDEKAIRDALLANGEPDKKDDASPAEKRNKVSSPPVRITPDVAPTKTDEERAAEIAKALEVDDKIKSSVGGMGARAIQNRKVPLGMAERRQLERELARLRGGR